MKAGGKTDWKRVKREAKRSAPVAYAPEKELYDPNDAKAVKAFWEAARIRRPGRPRLAVPKQPVTLRVDAEVAAKLRASGRGWQTRVNRLLAEAVREGRV